MAKPEIEGKVVFLRIEARNGTTFEIDIDSNRNVDAVFTSMDVVEKILLPFYERLDPKEAAELRRQLAAQLKESGTILGQHSASCRTHVPPIHPRPGGGSR